MAEILRLAIQKQGAENRDLRQRLLAVGGELGLSPEAIAEAELEYRVAAARKKELALYDKDRRGALRIHFGVYMIVNAAFVGLNILTYQEDRQIWAPAMYLLWGIGLAIHALVSTRKFDWDDEEFQKWRVERAEKRGEIL